MDLWRYSATQPTNILGLNSQREEDIYRNTEDNRLMRDHVVQTDSNLPTHWRNLVLLLPEMSVNLYHSASVASHKKECY